jgi:hypothetical protein
MSRSIFQSFIWRMGFRLGDKQIAHAINWTVNPSDLAREEQSSVWKRLSTDMSFEAGYNAAWSDLGRQDARNGLCRAAKFRSHGYNSGWRGEFSKLAAKGWQNPALNKEAELLEKHYWANLASGASDEYYKVVSQQSTSAST